ncbi:MAG: hypothetical protein NWQ28_08045 [Nodularia sp. (in: cyanobacteria)]|nr:hypothetical protein [Nodularia sp. (in: cyanobacteria)]
MKLPNRLTLSALILAISSITYTFPAKSQSNTFSCQALSQYGLNANSSECLQNKPANNSPQTNRNANQKNEIKRHGLLMINKGKTGQFDIQEIEIYKDGIKANIPNGYVAFIASGGIGYSSERLMFIENVVINQNGKSNTYTIKNKQGRCSTTNLIDSARRNGVFIGFVGIDKFTTKTISMYATNVVECKAVDNQGNELALSGMVMVLRE